MKISRVFTLLLIIISSGCNNPLANQLQDGDIIFQTSLSPQSKAIQLATHSKYSHVGIVFFENGKPYVFEAIQTVQYTPLQKWIDRGKDKKYVIKRLKNDKKKITAQSIKKLKAVAATFKGKPYDLIFEWSDQAIYCSELVWKIYDRGMGIQIGSLKELQDFDLSHEVVKRKIKKRYGNQIPKEETVISPGDMFSSQLLYIVAKNK